MTYRDRIVAEAAVHIGSDHAPFKSAAPGYNLAVVSWCAIFCVYVLRAVGLTTLTWVDVVRRGYTAGWLKRTSEPRPGDVGLIIDTNGDGVPEYHHAIVERIGTDTVNGGAVVWTIDGNSIGRRVQRRKRPLADFDAFYSIQSLIDEVEGAETEPPPAPAWPTEPEDSGTSSHGHAERREVSTAELSEAEIVTARAAGRLRVDADGLGWVDALWLAKKRGRK